MVTEAATSTAAVAAALEHLPEAVIIVDGERVIHHVNAAAAALFGYRRDELLGRDLLELHSLGASKAARDQIAAALARRGFLASGEPLPAQVQGRSKRGDTVPCEVSQREFHCSGERFRVVLLRRTVELSASEQRSLDQESLLANVVENFPMAVTIKDVRDELRYVMVNKGYESLFGVSRDVVVGATDYDLIPRREADTVTSYYREVLAGAPAMQGQTTPVTSNRGRIFVRSFNTVLYGDDGDPHYVLSVLEDRSSEVFAAREARVQRERMQNYLRIADAVLMDIRADGRIMVGNDKLSRACGVPVDALAGIDYRDLPFTGEARTEWLRVVGNALCGVQQEGEVDSFGTYLGEYFFRWKILANKHRRKDEIFSVTVVGEDITEIHHKRLEAEAANRAKSEFLANMSHELRTPLNAIIGYSEMLKEVAEEEERREDIGDLERVMAAGRHLQQLINEVLDLARAESGRLAVEAQRVDLGAVLEEIRGVSGSVITANGNELIIDGAEHAPLFSDSMKIKQILLNLVGNAAKFTRHGRVWLSYEIDEARARFTVTDDGVGIDEDAQARIFEAFAQADGSTTRHYGGTGLGLAICKRFCELLGGEISVRSAPGSGSSFAVTLPQLTYCEGTSLRAAE